MKRIVIIATLVVFAQIAAGFSTPAPQTFPRATALRRIDVNAKTITALAPGKNYVVDLTNRGVVYEFSHQAGAIDLSRVKVRTARGEVAIGSYLETTFLKDKLAGFKYKSQAFSLATLPPGTLQDPPTGTTNIACGKKYCVCTNQADCIAMFFSQVCGGEILCTNYDSGLACSCLKA
jgi:hypothetical protein